jgi:hypothetical protein
MAAISVTAACSNESAMIRARRASGNATSDSWSNVIDDRPAPSRATSSLRAETFDSSEPERHVEQLRSDPARAGEPELGCDLDRTTSQGVVRVEREERSQFHHEQA